MEENISRERKLLFRSGMILVSGICAIAAGLTLGSGIRVLGGPDLRIVLCCLFAVALLFQGYSDLPKTNAGSGAYRWGVRLSGGIIAFLIYDLGILVPVRLIELLIPAARNRVCAAITAVGAACMSILISIYGILHARQVRVRSYRLPSGALEKGETYRIVHLSDLHIGSIVGRRFLRRVVSMVNALHPDLIVITGDLVNHGTLKECGDVDGIASILAGLQAKDGVFAVTGNHDPGPEDPTFRHFLSEAKIRLLRNETVILPRCILSGRDGTHIHDRQPSPAFPETDGERRIRVALDHYPDGLPDGAAAGADLFLCGHTHNGQYFPLMYLIRRKYRNGTAYGKSEYKGTTCIVSSGTGCSQIPIRIGTDSEIACIHLHG